MDTQINRQMDEGEAGHGGGGRGIDDGDEGGMTIPLGGQSPEGAPDSFKAKVLAVAPASATHADSSDDSTSRA